MHHLAVGEVTAPGRTMDSEGGDTAVVQELDSVSTTLFDLGCGKLRHSQANNLAGLGPSQTNSTADHALEDLAELVISPEPYVHEQEDLPLNKLEAVFSICDFIAAHVISYLEEYVVQQYSKTMLSWLQKMKT